MGTLKAVNAININEFPFEVHSQSMCLRIHAATDNSVSGNFNVISVDFVWTD